MNYNICASITHLKFIFTDFRHGFSFSFSMNAEKGSKRNKSKMN